ncbi:MAG: MFS transporter [Anaerolineae bacterium]|nr:MFS transporter [Anaerolineae bacterium]
MKRPQSEKLPFITKFFYGFGDIGFALTDTVVGLLFANFMIKVVGLTPGQAALAIFIGHTWDWINDPLFGSLSDRMRSRWGRRRVFLLFGFIPFALAFLSLWWIPPFTQPWMLVGYYAFAFVLYDAGATLVYMPYYALTPELTQDYDERTRLTSFRMAFSILGSLIAFTVPLEIIGERTPDKGGIIFITMLGLAIFSALPLLGTFFATWERAELQKQEKPSLRESLHAALKNKPFLYAVGIFLFTFTALSIIESMLLFFITDRLGMGEFETMITAGVFVTALVTLPFWNWISNKKDKRTAYMAGMIFFSLVMSMMVLVNPNWGIVPVMALAILAGVGVGAIQVLPWAMLPDAIEVDELETGARHEGMFYSLVMLLRKMAPSIALPLTLLVMEWSGYQAGAAVQTPEAVRAVQTLTGPVPAVMLMIGVFFAIRYPLTRKRYQEVREQLALRQDGAG